MRPTDPRAGLYPYGQETERRSERIAANLRRIEELRRGLRERMDRLEKLRDHAGVWREAPPGAWTPPSPAT